LISNITIVFSSNQDSFDTLWTKLIPESIQKSAKHFENSTVNQKSDLINKQSESVNSKFSCFSNSTKYSGTTKLDNTMNAITNGPTLNSLDTELASQESSDRSFDQNRLSNAPARCLKQVLTGHATGQTADDIVEINDNINCREFFGQPRILKPQSAYESLVASNYRASASQNPLQKDPIATKGMFASNIEGESMQNQQMRFDSTNLYITGFGANFMYEDLESLLHDYKPIMSYRIINGHTDYGIAFARLKTPELARQAVQKLNGIWPANSRKLLRVKLANKQLPRSASFAQIEVGGQGILNKISQNPIHSDASKNDLQQQQLTSYDNPEIVANDNNERLVLDKIQNLSVVQSIPRKPDPAFCSSAPNYHTSPHYKQFQSFPTQNELLKSNVSLQYHPIIPKQTPKARSLISKSSANFCPDKNKSEFYENNVSYFEPASQTKYENNDYSQNEARKVFNNGQNSNKNISTEYIGCSNSPMASQNQNSNRISQTEVSNKQSAFLSGEFFPIKELQSKLSYSIL